MAWDDKERARLAEVLETLDQPASKFERLVETKSRRELLDELGRLNQSELRRILLARVLVEQHRRGESFED